MRRCSAQDEDDYHALLQMKARRDGGAAKPAAAKPKVAVVAKPKVAVAATKKKVRALRLSGRVCVLDGARCPCLPLFEGFPQGREAEGGHGQGTARRRSGLAAVPVPDPAVLLQVTATATKKKVTATATKKKVTATATAVPSPAPPLRPAAPLSVRAARFDAGAPLPWLAVACRANAQKQKVVVRTPPAVSCLCPAVSGSVPRLVWASA